MVVKFHFMCTLKGVSDFSDLTEEILVLWKSDRFGEVVSRKSWSHVEV